MHSTREKFASPPYKQTILRVAHLRQGSLPQHCSSSQLEVHDVVAGESTHLNFPGSAVIAARHIYQELY